MASSSGARKSGAYLAVSDAPDVCRTPPGNVPVPYLIVARLDAALSVSPNVNLAGSPAVLADESSIPTVSGDEAGIGGGVKSGRNGGAVRFIHGSGSVRINGQRAVREHDAVTMNHGNTTGRVVALEGAAPTGRITANGRPSTDTNPPPPQPLREEPADE